MKVTVSVAGAAFMMLMSLSVCNDQALAAERTVQFKIPGVVCPTSSSEAKSALKSMSGVIDAVPDFENHRVTVTFEDTKTDTAAMKKALEDAGYPIESVVSAGR